MSSAEIGAARVPRGAGNDLGTWGGKGDVKECMGLVKLEAVGWWVMVCSGWSRNEVSSMLVLNKLIVGIGPRQKMLMEDLTCPVWGSHQLSEKSLSKCWCSMFVRLAACLFQPA